MLFKAIKLDNLNILKKENKTPKYFSAEQSNMLFKEKTENSPFS